ncbi:MAG: adenylate/guanylate cyclase domain-containing protein, partial [Mycobacterium sp.]|nr:adenylate/guanylate cyclase domain-containing protein [Mycobacterium sp.]
MVKVRPVCVPDVALDGRAWSPSHHRDDRVGRRLKVLTIAGWIAAAVSIAFGLFQLVLGGALWWLGAVNVACGLVFLTIPRLCRFGELVAPLTFVAFAYVSLGFICFTIGTGSGLQFYTLVAASLAVLILGIERIVLAAVIAVVGVVMTIALELTVPHDRG